MLFSEVMLDNLVSYINIINLCITSVVTVNHISRYYICHIPKKISYEKISNDDMDGWDIFMDNILSRPLFNSYSNFSIRLYVLLKFLKAENSLYTNPIITPSPITNISIHSEMVRYNYGNGCMKELDTYWNTDSFDDIDTVGYFGLDSTPFVFTIKSKLSTLGVLHGIVYLSSEYRSHQLDLIYKSDVYPGKTFNMNYHEEFHVLNVGNVDHIIVILRHPGKNDIVKPRCNLQYICHKFHQKDINYSYINNNINNDSGVDDFYNSNDNNDDYNNCENDYNDDYENLQPLRDSFYEQYFNNICRFC